MEYPQLAVMNISHRYFDLEEFFSSAAASGYTCCELWTGAMHLYVDCHGYDSLEQVQELVNYAKYYPIGQRGFCPSRKDGWGFDGLGSVPETMRHFNGETLLFPQCETAEALDIIEDICADAVRLMVRKTVPETPVEELANVMTELSDGQISPIWYAIRDLNAKLIDPKDALESASRIIRRQ